MLVPYTKECFSHTEYFLVMLSKTAEAEISSYLPPQILNSTSMVREETRRTKMQGAIDSILFLGIHPTRSRQRAWNRTREVMCALEKLDLNTALGIA